MDWVASGVCQNPVKKLSGREDLCPYYIGCSHPAVIGYWDLSSLPEQWQVSGEVNLSPTLSKLDPRQQTVSARSMLLKSRCSLDVFVEFHAPYSWVRWVAIRKPCCEVDMHSRSLTRSCLYHKLRLRLELLFRSTADSLFSDCYSAPIHLRYMLWLSKIVARKFDTPGKTDLRPRKIFKMAEI
jgi:hypothetical protein